MAVPQQVRSNEFLNSPIDSSIRPYNVGLTRHNETLASILVYKKEGRISDTAEEVDFLSSLETKVEALTNAVPRASGGAGASAVGVPEQPTGEISNDSLDGKNDYYGIYNNFSLLNVQEANDQIVKLHVNFGADWNAFFFGEQPRVYQFSGFFLDSMDYPYYQEFMTAYDKYLSGRKSVENRVQIKFIYDGKIVDGYMLNIKTSQTAADQLIKSFQFTVLVKGFYWIRTNLLPRFKEFPKGNRIIMEEEFNGLSNLHRLRKENLTDVIAFPQQPSTTDSGKVYR